MSKTKTKKKRKLKVDLGCGQNKQEGFVGVDISSSVDADVVHDLTQFPWPFEDNQVEEVFCSHYVEHVPDLIEFMHELYRICCKKAQVRIVHPYLLSRRAWQDPTHKQFLSEAAWPYFAKDWRELNRLDHYPIHCDFGILNIMAIYKPEWAQRSQEAQQFAMSHYWDVVDDLVVDLECRK